MPYKNVYISRETIRAIDDAVRKSIKIARRDFGFEPALIKAIAKKESKLYIFSYRVDYSVLKKQQWYRNTITAEQKKYKSCWASYGYMQVLFGLARHYGFKGAPVGLFAPEQSIYYGCVHLDYLRKRYHSHLKDMIHAYNWGSNAWMDYDHDGIHDSNEPYKNQAYVDEIYEYYKGFGGKL